MDIGCSVVGIVIRSGPGIVGVVFLVVVGFRVRSLFALSHDHRYEDDGCN